MEKKEVRHKLLVNIKYKKAYLGGIFLVIGSFIAGVLNYGFNAYLGRILSFEDFALIGLMGGFYSLASIFFSACSTTTDYRVSYLIGKSGENAGYSFWRYARRRSVYFSIIITVGWLMLIPLLMRFFDTGNIYLFLLFSMVLLVGFVNSIDSGFLSARLMFGSMAIIALFDPISKLAMVGLLSFTGHEAWSYSALPVAVLVVFIGTWLLIVKQVPKVESKLTNETGRSSRKFFFTSLLTGFASIAFFTFDILLANHFLSQKEAGEYTMISLVGKMIFFLGNMTSPFIVPLISRNKGANKESGQMLNIMLISTSFLAIIGFVGLGIFGWFTVPILYGSKTISIVPYLLYFTFGMACYTVSRVLINYYLVHEIYTFTVTNALLVVVQLWLIYLFHSSVQDIAFVMSFVLVVNLILTVILHWQVVRVCRFETDFHQRIQLIFKK